MCGIIQFWRRLTLSIQSLIKREDSALKAVTKNSDEISTCDYKIPNPFPLFGGCPGGMLWILAVLYPIFRNTQSRKWFLRRAVSAETASVAQCRKLNSPPPAPSTLI